MRRLALGAVVALLVAACGPPSALAGIDEARAEVLPIAEEVLPAVSDRWRVLGWSGCRGAEDVAAQLNDERAPGAYVVRWVAPTVADAAAAVDEILARRGAAPGLEPVVGDLERYTLAGEPPVQLVRSGAEVFVYSERGCFARPGVGELTAFCDRSVSLRAFYPQGVEPAEVRTGGDRGGDVVVDTALAGPLDARCVVAD